MPSLVDDVHLSSVYFKAYKDPPPKRRGVHVNAHTETKSVLLKLQDREYEDSNTLVESFAHLKLDSKEDQKGLTVGTCV